VLNIEKGSMGKSEETRVEFPNDIELNCRKLSFHRCCGLSSMVFIDVGWVCFLLVFFEISHCSFFVVIDKFVLVKFS